MSSPRLATIPFEHVEAELAGFPLASESSFRLGITSLEPLISKNDTLWSDAEKHVLQTLPSIPPDETVAIRDKLWFNSSNQDVEISKSVSLYEYVKRLAESYLDSNGRPIPDSSATDFHGYVGPEARLRWSWLCRALPPDFLRVVRGVVDPDSHQFPLHPVIQQLLQDQGFAETHLHLGASPDFSLGWASLMWGLTKDESKHSDFENFGADFDHGRELGTWVLYAAVVRLLLAQRLFSDSSSGSSKKDLLQYACERHKNRIDVIECSRLATLLSEFRQGKWSEFQESQTSIKPKKQLAKRFARTRALLRSLIGSSGILHTHPTVSQKLRALQNPECRSDIYLNDPLARIVGWHPTEALSPETLFVAKALKHIEKNEKDADFAKFFWQVIRIRCLVYRHVVQRPLTPGLQWFVRFFSRIKPVRKNIPESVLAITAARVCGKDVGLRSLEVRLGTEESITECLMKVRNIERSVNPVDKHAEWRPSKLINKVKIDKSNKEKNEADKIELGAVFHFSRKRGGGWEQGKLNAFGLDNSYPGKASSGKAPNKKPIKGAGNPSGFRFARFYMEQKRHAQALVSLFQKYPRSLRTIRGFDLCTDEAGVPVWVMAPLIRWVREAGQQAATQLKRRSELNIPPTRLSVHAGEDFIHLLSGLRRLDETLTYLKLEEGDRLGHALSLGVDPSVWCRRAGRVVITREERLFDLIWEWSRYAKHSIGVSSDRLAYVRTEIVRLAKYIFDKSCSPEELMNFVYQLNDEQRLRAEGFPDKPVIRAYNSEQRSEKEQDKSKGLLTAFLRHKDVWRRGRVTETIDLRNVKHEEASLCQLQDELRRKVGKLCLTIEVNPSSNLLIGDLGNFVGHPLWRLKPVLPKDDVSPLSICIGSDDPLTFATTLPHEYQLLFDALILMGHSHDEAMKWLNATRDAGMQSRFTLPPNVTQLSSELKTPNLLGWERPQSPP
jgi:hypothetical protein